MCLSTWSNHQDLEIHRHCCFCSSNFSLTPSRFHPQQFPHSDSPEKPRDSSRDEAECHNNSTQHRKSRSAETDRSLSISSLSLNRSRKFPNHPEATAYRRTTSLWCGEHYGRAPSRSRRSRATPPERGSTGCGGGWDLRRRRRRT